MKILPCDECGATATVQQAYSTGTGQGHGYAVICNAGGQPGARHWGPWAQTPAGAVRLWNRKARSHEGPTD